MPALARPNYALLLLMAVLGLLPIFNSGYAHPVVYPLSMALGTGALLSAYRQGKGPPSPERDLPAPLRLPWLFLLAFMFWAALGLVWSVDRYETLLALDEFLMNAAVFLLAATGLSRAGAGKLVRFNLIIGAAVSLVGLLIFVFVSSERIRSTFVNPNPFGAYAAMLLAAALFFYLQEKRRWVVAVIVILGDALVLSGSRGAWLSLAVGLGAAWLGLDRRQRWPAARSFVLPALGVVITTLLIITAAPLVQHEARTWLEATFWGRWLMGMSIIRPETLTSTSGPGRLSFWLVAWRMALEYFWGGVGLGNYHTAYFLFWPGDRFYSRFAHNFYLQTAADTGWPGLTLLFAFVVLLLWRLWRRREGSCLFLGLWGASLVFLAHSFIDFSWNIPAVAALFWAQLGMMAVLGRNEAGFDGEGGYAGVARDGGAKIARRLFFWRTNPGLPRAFQSYPVAVLAVWLTVSSAVFWAGEVLADRGRSAVAREDLKTGLARLQLAVTLVPLAPAYRADLAWAYWQAAEKWDQEYYRRQARQQLEKAVQLSPLDYDYSLQLGELLMAGGDYRTAEVYLRRAAVSGGFVPQPYADLGYLYLRTERYGEALEVLNRGLEMADLAGANAPTPGEKQRVLAARLQMYLGRARAYEALGNWSARRADLEAALEIDPENEVARRELKKVPPVSGGM